VKSPEQVTADIERRLQQTWNNNLDSEARDWPHTFPLGEPVRTDLEKDFNRHQDLSLAMRRWARRHGLGLVDAPRLVLGTTQRIPTHVAVDSIDTAAQLCGVAWTARLVRGRDRLAALRDQDVAGDRVRVVRDVDGYSDLDFALLCSVVDWFRRHGDTARGLTPRQVPVPGLQAKWLNSRHRLIATLAGLPDLGLRSPHPARIHFTYLDPDHRAAGRRWHDSASVGDAMRPAYHPRAVIITENKDTAVGFPPVAGGISVEGSGTGGSTPAAIGWLRDCPTIIYWGDMDGDGLNILHQYRTAGLAVRSILMDVPTYDVYAEFGTDYDVKGTLIKVSTRRNLLELTAGERELYDRLTDPTWTGYRRIEQERIPLAVARAAVQAVLENQIPMATG